jgi:hypothetical protein
MSDDVRAVVNAELTGNRGGIAERMVDGEEDVAVVTDFAAAEADRTVSHCHVLASRTSRFPRFSDSHTHASLSRMPAGDEARRDSGAGCATGEKHVSWRTRKLCTV